MPARAILPPLLAIVLLATGCSSGGSSSPSTAGSSGFDGAAIPGAPFASDFTLLDQAGRPASLGSYRGQVVVLTFLYSTCGATCTLIAQQIRGALDELAHPAPVLIVSADPTADTPTRVASFLSRVSLAGRARYLTGQAATLRTVWRAYRVSPASAGRAAFERSAQVLLLDRDGRERVIFGLEQLTPEALAHDLEALR